MKRRDFLKGTVATLAIGGAIAPVIENAPCGKSVPFPPYHDIDAGARLLMAYSAGTAHAEAD